MANAIKGITVQIGGDTSDLNKALRDVNTESRNLQKELKEVDRLLELDPGNVELLTQKQELLAQSIGGVKDKLDILKQAQADVQAQFDKGEITEEQYRNFQRTIEDTKIKLDELNDSAEDFGSVMGERLEEAGSRITDAGEKITGAGQALAPVSAAATGLLVGTGKMASDFTDAMAKVNTIADTSSVSLDELSEQVMTLSSDTNVGASEIADAVYNAISAGQDTADAVAFVGNATDLARAGFADTGASLDLLTTIMNAYGLEADDVTHASEALITTQNLGKTTVAELSSVMGRIIPTAKANGVELDQLCGSYAVMTANGISTAETTTYLNSMLNELGKSGSTASDSFRAGTEDIKEGGLSMEEAMESGWSLTDVLAVLEDEAKKSGKSVSDMFGSSEAGKAATVLLDNADDVNSAIEAIGDSTGAVDEALEKLETPSYNLEVAFNQLKNTGIELGNSVMEIVTPMITGLCDAIENLTTWFNSLDPSTQTLITTILMIIAVAAPVLILIGNVVSGIGNIVTGIGGFIGFLNGTLIPALSGVFSFIAANPIVLIIGAIITAVVLLIANWETVRDVAIWVWDQVSQFFANCWNGIVEFVTVTVPQAFSNFVTFIGQWFNDVINWFSQLPGNIWNFLQDCINNVATWAADIGEKATSAASDFLDNVVEWFTKLPGRVWDFLTDCIDNLTEWVSDMATKGAEGAQELFDAVVDGVKGLPDKMLSIGGDLVNGLWNGISDGAGWLLEKASGWATGIVDGIKGFFGIQSPSRRMRDEVGKQIPPGLAEGIEETGSQPIAAMDSLADEMADTIDPDLVFTRNLTGNSYGGAGGAADAGDGGTGGAGLTIVLQYKDLTLGRAVISDLKELTKLNGNNPVLAI